MGASWYGVFKLGGDGQRTHSVEMEPNEVVHNKLVQFMLFNLLLSSSISIRNYVYSPLRQNATLYSLL